MKLFKSNFLVLLIIGIVFSFLYYFITLEKYALSNSLFVIGFIYFFIGTIFWINEKGFFNSIKYFIKKISFFNTNKINTDDPTNKSTIIEFLKHRNPPLKFTRPFIFVGIIMILISYLLVLFNS